MKLKFRYSILAVIVIMMTQCAPKKNYPDELDKMVPGASFIFKGKVLILHTTLTDEEDVSNTGAVVVNEVLDEAFENFSNLTQILRIIMGNINTSLRLEDSEEFGNEVLLKKSVMSLASFGPWI